MLVLSRKEGQSISFSGLGVTIQVLRVNGSNTRLGIEAPMEVRIVRDELGAEKSTEPEVLRIPSELRHKFLNELNSLSIGLHLYEQELAAGHTSTAKQTLEQIKSRLHGFSQENLLTLPLDKVKKKEGLSALIVEDQANEREMLAGILRMHGYSVATAANGLEAIDLLESKPETSVMLIDMRMPRCDGPTTIKRIRERHRYDDLKIFAISASTPEAEHVETGEVERWFMKPLDPNKLVSAIQFASASSPAK